MLDFVDASTGVGSRGLCIGGRSVEVRNFARRSDLGSLDSQQHNLIDYLNGPAPVHCQIAAIEPGGVLDTTPLAEQ